MKVVLFRASKTDFEKAHLLDKVSILRWKTYLRVEYIDIEEKDGYGLSINFFNNRFCSGKMNEGRNYYLPISWDEYMKRFREIKKELEEKYNIKIPVKVERVGD